MKPRILILDNDRDILSVLEEILQYENFDVITEEETSDIFSLVDKHKPQLVLMDYSLRDNNGGELCAWLKSRPETKQLPVIIFSAYLNHKFETGSYGCDEFIAKPFDIDELMNKIRNLVATKVQAS